MNTPKNYDAIIIGAGIGGLVCASYLAKSGLKVLVIEKNSQPGGYCNSFKIKNYQFDAFAHALGGIRKGGHLGKILHELDLLERLEFERHNPSEIMITPDFRINFWNNADQTLRDLQADFPFESANIKNFFNFIASCEQMTFGPLTKMTFSDLLNRYFSDFRLKGILSLPPLGYVGLSASTISAFSAVIIYKEFLFDGGYYPKGGMQSLPNIFVDKIKELKGDVWFSNAAKKIIISDNKVIGVEVDKQGFIPATYVISNADVRQTFFDLMSPENINLDLKKTIDSLSPSISMFVLYIGLDDNIKTLPQLNASIWFLPHYDTEKIYKAIFSGDFKELNCFLFRISGDRKSILALANAPYVSEEFWQNNRRKYLEDFIKGIEQIIPDLPNHIAFRAAATPPALHKWTSNYHGAAYGWASTPSQIFIKKLSLVTQIENFYLTGHWTTLAQGVPGVAYLGKTTANIILRKKKNEKK